MTFEGAAQGQDAGICLAILVLRSTRWLSIERHIGEAITALDSIKVGEFAS